MVSEKLSGALQPDYKFQKLYRFVEHRVSLEDGLAQILTQPNEFSMLNLYKTDILNVPLAIEPDAIITYLFDLSQ